MPRIVLINPNTSTATTDTMVAIAAAHAGPRLAISGLTAELGAPLIVDMAMLETSRTAVLRLEPRLRQGVDGVIVSAFGDPGLDELRSRLRVPVAGIGEAGMLAAAAGRRRLAVVTTTPGLVAGIDAKAASLGLGACYAGVELTVGDPAELTADPPRLEAALAAAIRRALEARGAEAIVIGGGPLASAARALAPRFAVPIIEPIPAAVDWMLARLPGEPS